MDLFCIHRSDSLQVPWPDIGSDMAPPEHSKMYLRCAMLWYVSAILQFPPEVYRGQAHIPSLSAGFRKPFGGDRAKICFPSVDWIGTKKTPWICLCAILGSLGGLRKEAPPVCICTQIRKISVSSSNGWYPELVLSFSSSQQTTFLDMRVGRAVGMIKYGREGMFVLLGRGDLIWGSMWAWTDLSKGCDWLSVNGPIHFGKKKVFAEESAS